MKIAIIGLGKMGAQIAKKLAENNHEVIGHDPVRESVDNAAASRLNPGIYQE